MQATPSVPKSGEHRPYYQSTKREERILNSSSKLDLRCLAVVNGNHVPSERMSPSQVLIGRLKLVLWFPPVVKSENNCEAQLCVVERYKLCCPQVINVPDATRPVITGNRWEILIQDDSLVALGW